MLNLNLESGLVEVKLNDNEENIVRFNPTAVGFFEEYLGLLNFINSMQTKYSEIEKTALEKGQDIETLEVSTKEYSNLYNEVAKRVDALFGKETVLKAKRAVNDNSDDMLLLVQIVNGLGVHVLKASNDKMSKYTKQYMNREQRRAAEKKKK